MTINNERGYTLILVMIIITVTMILALALSGMAVNTRMQVNRTDEQNKATDLAEMGITYYLETVKSKITIANAADATANFCKELKNQLNNSNIYEPKTVEGQNKYQVTLDKISTPCDTNPEEISISFNSKGITSNEEVTVNGEFNVKKNTRVGEIAPNLSDFTSGTIDTTYTTSDKIYYGDEIIKQDKSYVLDNAVWFKKLTIQGNGGPLTIRKNDAIFESIDMNAHTKLIIEGDVIFLNRNPIDKLTNKATICVSGDAYYVSNGLLEEFDLTTINSDNSTTCDRISANRNWSIDPIDGISVSY
jgi:Tfp pilus assembly protein PilX